MTKRDLLPDMEFETRYLSDSPDKDALEADRRMHDKPGVTETEAANGFPEQRSALPGSGGLSRIAAATRNSLRGIAEGARAEAAVKQELALLAAGVPLAFLIATNAWIWLAMICSLLLVLMVEFLNTATEQLCNHVTPERHEAIRITKDLASAGVFFALVMAGLVWSAAVLDRFGTFG